MQKTRSIALSTLAVSTLVASSLASAELSGNIGLTSNYIWRGVTQSDDGPAAQGGIDYSHASGFYAGTWLSNVDFGGADDLNEYEHDLYLGYAGEAGAFGYDVGMVHYMYPLADDADFTELALSGSYGSFGAGVAYTFNSDVEDGPGAAFAESDLYYFVSAGFELPQDFGLGLLVGSYAFENDGVGGTELDYTHYQVALSKGDFTFALDQNDLDGAVSGKDLDDPRFSVAWGMEF